MQADRNSPKETQAAFIEPASDLLLFRAIPQPNLVKAVLGSNGEPAMVFPNSIVLPPAIEKELQSRYRTLWFNAHTPPQSEPPPYIINFCADCDTYEMALDWLAKKPASSNVRIFNHPSEVAKTRRDVVSELLQSVPGLTVPQCVRFRAHSFKSFLDAFRSHGFHYPVLVRPAGSQTGRELVRISDKDDWNEIRKIAWFDRTIYMTQFFDFRNSKGEYVKLRIANVGGKSVVRHVKIGSHWMVHNASSIQDLDKREAYLGAFDRDEKLTGIVGAIRERIQLDYWGIDLGYDGKNYVFFEGNPAMTMAGRSGKVEESVPLESQDDAGAATGKEATPRKEIVFGMVRSQVFDRMSWLDQGRFT